MLEEVHDPDQPPVELCSESVQDHVTAQLLPGTIDRAIVQARLIEGEVAVEQALPILPVLPGRRM